MPHAHDLVAVDGGDGDPAGLEPGGDVVGHGPIRSSNGVGRKPRPACPASFACLAPNRTIEPIRYKPPWSGSGSGTGELSTPRPTAMHRKLPSGLGRALAIAPKPAPGRWMSGLTPFAGADAHDRPRATGDGRVGSRSWTRPHRRRSRPRHRPRRQRGRPCRGWLRAPHQGLVLAGDEADRDPDESRPPRRQSLPAAASLSA